MTNPFSQKSRFLHKAAVVLLALGVLLAASGCSQPKTKIGIIQSIDHPALNIAREGFTAALKDAGYAEDQIDVTYQNAQGDLNNLSTIADKLVSEKVDLILALSTQAAQTVAGRTATIPILATAVTDFVDAGLVNSNEAPGANVSGVSDNNPVEAQLELLFRLCPDVKTVGFLYNSSETNSAIQVLQAKKVLDEMGIPYVEYTVTGTNDVQQAANGLAGSCDAVYIPTDNATAAAMPIVGAVAAEHKLPVVCGESDMVAAGGLATLALDYYELGYRTGEMAVKVLKGENISLMPVQQVTEYDFYINQEAAENLGIQIPEDLAAYVK